MAPDHDRARGTRPRLDDIDWTNQSAEVIDGFTVADIDAFSFDGVVLARCTECGDEREVEPDARRYRCESCGAIGSVTSPLVKLGLI